MNTREHKVLMELAEELTNLAWDIGVLQQAIYKSANLCYPVPPVPLGDRREYAGNIAPSGVDHKTPYVIRIPNARPEIWDR